jgi:hypothetical protein
MGGGGTSPRVRKPLRRLRVGRVPAPGELEPTAAVRLRRRTGRRAFSVARFLKVVVRTPRQFSARESEKKGEGDEEMP